MSAPDYLPFRYTPFEQDDEVDYFIVDPIWEPGEAESPTDPAWPDFADFRAIVRADDPFKRDVTADKMANPGWQNRIIAAACEFIQREYT
jgi:hypothetical protein